MVVAVAAAEAAPPPDLDSQTTCKDQRRGLPTLVHVRLALSVVSSDPLKAASKQDVGFRRECKQVEIQTNDEVTLKLL